MVSVIENRKCWIIHGKPGVKPTPLDELHPLLFPPVLNKVFSYLSVWNQKKCRTVCKSWAAELRPFLRLNCKVNLSKLVASFADDEESDKGDQDDVDQEHITLLKGISQICNSFVIEEDPLIIHILLQTQKETPLPIFSIKYLEIKNFQWNLSHVTKILRELPLLEELRLPILCSTSTSPGKENYSPILNSNTHRDTNGGTNRTKLCPHHHHTNKYISKSASIISNWKRTARTDFLQDSQSELFHKLKRIIVTLTVRDLQFFDYKSAPIQPILELIQLTPHLEEVYYPNIVQFTSPFDNPARVLLENIINSQTLCRLSILKIDTFLSNTDLKTLTAKGLPFKSLQLTVTPAIHVKYLYEFLKVSEPTLNSLTLTFRDGFKLSTQFPLLSLQTMAIILWNGHFDFIAEIQKLKILIIVLIEMEEEMLEKLQPHNFNSQSNLQELEIHGNLSSKVGMAQRILTLMTPGSCCLIKLTLDWVDDSLLQIIFQLLPNLQELGILYGGFTEGGITGIPPTFCRDEYCDKDKEGYALGLKRRLGIGDLKRLTSLILTGDLTNVLLVLGVCQCNSLQQLELTARTGSKIGDVSINAIADGGLNSTLEFLRLKNFSELISKEAATHLRSKFEGREIHLC